MMSRRYIFAIGDTNRNDFKTLSLSKFRIFLFILIGICVLIGLTFIISRVTYKTKIHYQTMELRRENAILREKFNTWDDKLNKIHNDITDLKTRNQTIRITASLSLPEPELGIGGSENRFHAEFIEIPELSRLDQRIRQLESNLTFIHRSTSQLEEVLQSKIQEIAHYPSIRPVKGGWISSPFGNRLDPFTGVEEHHPALDISIKPESEVLSTGAGVVKAVNNKVIKNKGYGKYIIIDHSYGYTTLYAHLSKVFVQPGQKIKRWDLIGLTGNTGKSTAPHIHYGVYFKRKPQNPMNFLLE